MNESGSESTISIASPLFRGEQRLRIALVGMPNSGKSTLFNAVSSTAIYRAEFTGTEKAYGECTVQIDLDEASLIDLPSICSLQHLPNDDRVTLKYLLWGDNRPPVSAHEGNVPPAPFAPPDVIIQVIDASALDRHLELTLELSLLGRPLVLALNRMDEAENKGMHINCKALADRLQVPVIPSVALMGQGIYELFNVAVNAVRRQTCPLPQPPNKHIEDSLQPLAKILSQSEVHEAFQVPSAFLISQLANGDEYFMAEMQHHFPERLAELNQLRSKITKTLPRPLEEELHADRHHRAAQLFETVTRVGRAREKRDWRYWLDEMFLHPKWGLIGSLAVFALVLFMVFEVSAWLDGLTAARLIEWIEPWRPESLLGVIGRAIADGLIGLIGIVVPYMIPLVILLVILEESGIMQRIAFVLDRAFHRIGLHGATAVPFLLGLGCNVPAISAAANTNSGRERVIASVLITFVPCSARSAIILALAGKYLGGVGILAIFALTLLVIALVGKLLSRYYRRRHAPGQVLEIPEYAAPNWHSVLHTTWTRTSDILTIVSPLLVGGSILLALLSYIGADDAINTLFTPLTNWWLGLPVALGVPIVFGILRKELSLLMVYQALGTFEIGAVLDWVQIITFLIFLTFYIPCVSTFAVMLKTIGRKEAFFSVALSVTVAMLVAGAIRLVLEAIRYF